MRYEHGRPIWEEASTEVIAKIERVLKRIRFRHFMIPLEVEPHCTGLIIKIRVKDRRDGTLRDFWHYADGIFGWKVSDWDLPDEELIDLISARVKEVMAHEVDEAMLVDGKRRYERHRR